MHQFVPATDEMLYRPDGPRMLLVPYRCGLPCWHQLQMDVTQSFASPAGIDVSEGNATLSA
jgi:hypothetical protein